MSLASRRAAMLSPPWRGQAAVSRRSIVYFCSSLDPDDPVSGFTCGWVTEFARHVDRLDVVCMWSVWRKVPPNVRVITLFEAGTCNRGRSRRIRRLLPVAARLAGRRPAAAFYHLSDEFCAATAWMFRAVGATVALWYSFGDTSRALGLAHPQVTHVLAPTIGSLPRRSSKLSPVGHGIDVDRFTPPPHQCPDVRPRGGPSILSVGRLHPSKGQDAAIETLAILQQLLPQSPRLRIVGREVAGSAGRYSHLLAERARGLGVSDAVEFCGPLTGDELVAEYRSCDVLLSLTNHGSLDKTLLEAMACERLVVSSEPAFAEAVGGVGRDTVVVVRSPLAAARRIAGLRRMAPAEQEVLGRALRAIVLREHSLPLLGRKVVELLLGTESHDDAPGMGPMSI